MITTIDKPEIQSHYLYPAALFVSNEEYVVNTILGSCVAVCIWDPVNKIGGINHYMLAYWSGHGLASPKFGNIAIEKLLEKVLNTGAQKRNLRAKVFGGAGVMSNTNANFEVGKKNIEIAFSMLEDLKLPIVASSVGGNRGRKILFNTHSGEVKHKFVISSSTVKS